MAQPPESWNYRRGHGASGQHPPRSTRRAAPRNTGGRRPVSRRPSLEARYAPQSRKRQIRRPDAAHDAPPRPRRTTRRRKRGTPLLLWAAGALFSCFILTATVVWSLGQDVPAAGDAVVDEPSAPAPAQNVGECVFRSGGDELPAEVQDTLRQWFVRCYNAAARLEAPELDDLYDQSAAAQEACLLDEASVRFISRVRAMQPVDLTMTGFTIGLTVEECFWESGGGCTVTLQEDDQILFSFLDGRTSSSCGIENTFTFSADGKILSHEKTEDGFNLVRDVYGRQSASSREAAVENALNELLDAARADVERLNAQREQYLNSSVPDDGLSCDMAYDRQAAVAYARQWVGLTAMTRNPQWGIYDDYGGNCNNFTSQCLYAGGIPMDIQGYDTQQWKWYSDVPNTYPEARGRSSSWSGVDEFYTYVNENSGSGLVARADANLFTAEPGDVLQYGADGEWKHSVLVTEVIRDADGQPVDFLIASNTTDRIDWPMSAYAYADVRLIHILGYNH